MIVLECSYAEQLNLFHDHVREGHVDRAREVLEGLINEGIEEGFIYLSWVDLCKADEMETDPDKTREYLQRAIALATAKNDPQVVVASKVEFARVEAFLGDREEAVRYLQEARDGFLALHPDARWPEWRAKIILDIADIANHFVKNGFYDLARIIVEASIDLGAVEPFLYLAAGNICRSCSDKELYPRARDYLLKAIEAGEEKPDLQVVVAALAGLADTEMLSGDRERAERYHQQAKEKFTELPAIEQWETLRERVEKNPLDIAPGPVRFLLFTSPCPTCTTPKISRGRLSGGEGICKAC